MKKAIGTPHNHFNFFILFDILRRTWVDVLMCGRWKKTPTTVCFFLENTCNGGEQLQGGTPAKAERMLSEEKVRGSRIV
jgi:hypothetical protein